MFPGKGGAVPNGDYPGVLKDVYWTATRFVGAGLAPTAADVAEHVVLIPAAAFPPGVTKEDLAFLRYQTEKYRYSREGIPSLQEVARRNRQELHSPKRHDEFEEEEQQLKAMPAADARRACLKKAQELADAPDAEPEKLIFEIAVRSDTLMPAPST